MWLLLSLFFLVLYLKVLKESLKSSACRGVLFERWDGWKLGDFGSNRTAYELLYMDFFGFLTMDTLN